MNDDYISLKPAFVGGAEKARRNARKRMNQPHPNNRANYNNNRNKRHDNRNSSNGAISPYPKSMREYDRFFGSLLSSSASAFTQSQTDGNSHRKVMQLASSLLNVPSLPTPLGLQQQLANSEGGSIDARTHHLIQRSSSLLSNASYASSSSASGTYDNARDYYMSKAPLILEESRYIIADSLTKSSYNNNNNKRGDSGSFKLKLISTEDKYPKLANTRQRQYAPLILHFEIVSEPTISRKQQSGSSKWTRPGSVLLLRQKPPPQHLNAESEISPSAVSVLACIFPIGNFRQSSSSSSMLALMIFRRDDIDFNQFSMEGDMQTNDSSNETPIFFASPLTTLIAQIRQMEACLRMVKVAFMPKLLGQKGSTHIRFGDSSDEEEDEEEVVGDFNDDTNTFNLLQEGFYVDEEGGSNISDDEEEARNINHGADLVGLLDKIPSLNKTQECAAKRFLESPKESLILVQGPPGTGKSTFLVNVICRRLATNPNARLMVTAPTNKAVTVLAERFLDVVQSGDDDLSCKCNAVLIGVEDKLISSKNDVEFISPDTLTSPLRGIFVYTWIESIKNECLSLLDFLKSLHDTSCQTSSESCDMVIETLIKAEKVKTKIVMSIPSERSVCTYAKTLVQQIAALAAAETGEESMDESTTDSQSTASDSQLEDAIFLAEGLVEALDEMESPTQELLATARVIFCTLSTAGASIIKQTRRVDDLLIDEAAAATEPEICIPFHLRPQRLLAVGDPLQLPPTIMSRHAADMGLSVSMHERLMNNCGKEYFMLDHQYRMKPQISHFPCKQFYDGKIMNGKNVACQTYTSDSVLPMKGPYSFINVRGEECRMQPGGSYANEAECVAVVKVVETIAARNRGSDWHSTDKLRIITFYQGQVNQLRRHLSKRGFGKVLVATVDSSQGCEADVVIISFVRSSSKKGVRHAAGFLADDRRINVALTRARHQMICIGDAHGTIGQQGSQALKNLVSDAKQRDCLI